ncbi:MAG: hypothetical protein ACXVBJ_09360 [Flavisolibacter sp.]
MNWEYHQSTLSKAILTSVFIGFMATIVCLIYNIIFRESTGYRPADFINVSSLIFAINLIFFGAGLVYFFLLRAFKKGDMFFEILFALVILYCAWLAAHAHMIDPHQTSEFRTLLIGVIVIMGLGIELVPLFFHNRKFVDAVL